MAGITALDQEAINTLLGSVKQRGEYDRQLKTFMDSGQPGVEISLSEGPFAQKKPNSVKTGFESAKSREGAPEGASDNVRVLVHEDSVYLIRTDVAAA
jgi:hypothetical protein